MNVALGGSLYQQLHSEPGLMDHREPDDPDLAVQFATRHEVRLAPGSAFAQWAGGTAAMVNSLHGQGIKRLGERPGAGSAAPPTAWSKGCASPMRSAFAFGVQWHPEWRHESNPFYARTLEAFAQACAEHRRRRDLA